MRGRGSDQVLIMIMIILSLYLSSHLETPANGQAVVFLTGLLEVFISEISLFWEQYRTTLLSLSIFKDKSEGGQIRSRYIMMSLIFISLSLSIFR